MADSKVSDLTAATSVNSADVLYLIQSSTDKKISISTLLANLPNSLLKVGGLFAFNLNNPQIINNTGTINASTFFTVVNNTAGSYPLSIENGTHVGQVKLVMCGSAAGTSSITNNIKGSQTIVAFNDAGQTALFVWYDNDWWVIGGTATGDIDGGAP